MISHEINVRVRYAETDQMAFVYYGNYAMYFEVARVETFRMLGVSYKELEEAGTWMPVLEYKTKYFKPAKYDDNLRIVVKITDKPRVRIRFEYEVYNEKNELLNVAETTLVFVDAKTEKPALPPDFFQEKIDAHFR